MAQWKSESVSGSNLVFDIPAFRRAAKVATTASQECPPVWSEFLPASDRSKAGV